MSRTPEIDDGSFERLLVVKNALLDFYTRSPNPNDRNNNKMAVYRAILELTADDVKFPQEFETFLDLVRLNDENGGCARSSEELHTMVRAMKHLSRIIREANDIPQYEEKYASGLSMTFRSAIKATIQVDVEGRDHTVQFVKLTADKRERGSYSWNTDPNKQD